MKRYFYEVDYRYTDDKNDDHFFSIGYFSSLKNAKRAIESVQDKPGFRDSNGVFDVSKFAVDFDNEVVEKSKVILYELSHEYTDCDGYDNFTIFGLYSNYEEAETNRIKRITQSPYNQTPAGFLISECKVDLCGWSEGFTIY